MKLSYVSAYILATVHLPVNLIAAPPINSFDTLKQTLKKTSEKLKQI